MRLQDHHMNLNEQGIGKCSVPMWSMGMPAGFCDNDAYGDVIKKGGIYVGGLACPHHGGPKTRVFKDGDMFCAVHPDFINLQESLAGFGETAELARKNLLEAPHGR